VPGTAQPVRDDAEQARGRLTATGQLARDVLWASIFPNGIPAREGVIRAASGWLEPPALQREIEFCVPTGACATDKLGTMIPHRR
jgi:hypothetical protein